MENIWNKLKEWASLLKRQAKLLQVVYKDKRTPTKAKILIWITLGYLFSPIDLIPDFIPVLGILDDLIIVPLLIKLTLSLIPKNVVADAVAFVKSEPPGNWKGNWLIVALISFIWLALAYYLIPPIINYFTSDI